MSALLEVRMEIVRMLREWERWVERIAEAASRVLGGCEVYVFGSVVEGRATGGSDVDILIVSPRRMNSNFERWRLIALLEEEAGLPPYHPFEIHLVSRDEAGFYFRHIRVYKKIR